MRPAACILIATTCALFLAGCTPQLDDSHAVLKIPAALPGFDTQPPAPGIAKRAQDLLVQGERLASQGKLLEAVAKLTEALSLDPACAEARLALARTFALGGRSSVALALLRPAAEHVQDCGTCVEMLQIAQHSKELQHLREATAGRQLFAHVPQTPLPYLRWTADVAAALQIGSVQGLAPYVHSRLPFLLVRSCPACDVASATTPSRRELVGIGLAAKVAARFDTVHPAAFGIRLHVVQPPRCNNKCCDYSIPEPVPHGEAALRRLCFRATTPTQAVLTEVELVYGTPS